MFLGIVALAGIGAAAHAKNEVAIYTGTTQWITKAKADAQAAICVDALKKAGIKNTLLSAAGDMGALANWMKAVTNDKGLDVCVLYGDFPPSLYPEKNAQPDGSIAETFIESTDGDAFLNHADYMFWGLNGRNEEGGLKNMMDIPTITMWDDNTKLTVTAEGKAISPTLATINNLESDRPFHINELAKDWKVEVLLTTNAAGTRGDPIIVRDGNRGRLIPCIQTADQDEPKGAVAAEIITWLFKQFGGGSTAVEPKDKLSVTWAEMKER
jgi:hypothetical protein